MRNGNSPELPGEGCSSYPVVIIGAGPAGLSAAHELAALGRKSVLLEADEGVGGLSKTVQYKGYRFDIGGHRFFTKVGLVDRIWHDMLKTDLLKRKRVSHILYKRHFYQYPLQPLNVLQGLGPVEAVRCAASYLKALLFKTRPEENFEAYIVNRFGRRLFATFFESYTEKVWGVSCRKIRAEWAAQRIRGLSILELAKSSLGLTRGRKKSEAVKTLIEEFDYPRHGPGMMWDRMRDRATAKGVHLELSAPVTRIDWEPGRILSVEAGGRKYEASQFISSMPLRDFIGALHPAPPAPILEAREAFEYRDFISVCLIARGKPSIEDNWIYVHDPQVSVGRVQIFNNWSPDMVPDADTTCFGLEYFCFENDETWSKSDAELIGQATAELEHLGLVSHGRVFDGSVVRAPKAYPVYNDRHEGALDSLRGFLESVQNIQLVGRNGMHRYNNQDHSMLTGIFAARNIMGASYDLWAVNVDSDYLEEGPALEEAAFGSEPAEPRPRLCEPVRC